LGSESDPRRGELIEFPGSLEVSLRYTLQGERNSSTMMRRRSESGSGLPEATHLLGVLDVMTWPNIKLILILVGVADALAMALWYACSWPNSQVLGPALVRGPRTAKRIALTFDDGPFSPYTGQILDTLREHGIHATFFVCGKKVEQYPDIVRRIHAEGHTLGNHTWSHPYLYFLSRAKMAEEIDRTQGAICKITGQATKLFRPPYGARWFGLYSLLRERGMTLIQWSVNGSDWKLRAEDITAAVCAGLSPGAVILLHDGRQSSGGYFQRLLRKNAPSLDRGQLSAARSQTVEALPAIIRHAREAGFKFVPVEEFCST
jgi:peptidoglycan-N-acetylglucosamine deacetylase